MRKGLEKVKIHVYVYLNHFAVYLKPTQHLKSATESAQLLSRV